MQDNDYDQLISLGVDTSFARFFVDFDLPVFRKPKDKGNRRWPSIEVGGDCLRIGKTTTKKVLVEQVGAKGLPFVFSDEDWESNPYLKKSYHEASDSLLKSQMWFANRKKEQLTTISDAGIWIQVVNPEMDFGYAMTNLLLGRLTMEQFEEYWDYYKSLGWEKVPFPDLLVYLMASSDVLKKRFASSARDFERVKDEYFLVMQIVNRRWLRLVEPRLPVLAVDTDNFDYSFETGDENARKRLGEMLIERFEDEGWKL